jgi:cystathionine beta-lyase/cystathionine gamma-synthase
MSSQADEDEAGGRAAARARVETLVVHGGRPEPAIEGAIATPIFQTSTYASGEARDASYDAVRYSRLSNGPSHLVLHRRLAALMGAEAAVVCASGMAAISATLLALARSGERIFFQRGLYGGTQVLARRDLPRLGIRCDVAESDDVAQWRAAIRDGTRVIYCEAIANPLGTVIDLAAVVALAKEIGALAVIDATFASPVNLAPLALGFDIELHSATKYLNGHSDVIAGVVAGREALVRSILSLQNHLGGSLDPHACFLLERGLKTLPLRVRQQNANALALARYLSGHEAVSRVHYPGLDPERLVPASVRQAFKGYGGVLAFEVEPARAERFVKQVKVALHAPSLGGPETLVTRPGTTSHVGLGAVERAALGIHDGLVRVACGIEHIDDLIADFAQGLG